MIAFSRARVLILLVSVTFCSQDAFSQEVKKEPSGSVSGKVMLGDKPLPRAVVVLMPGDGMSGPSRVPSARATTDEEGHYRITGVPAGSYTLTPSTPAFVVPNETSIGRPGKSVTLGDGEEAANLDFSLVRGAVISGKVTDSDGRPVIEQHVNVIRIDERGQRVPGNFNLFSFGTDDRGIYRVYGLAPGRYKVSVGDAPNSGIVRAGVYGAIYARTFSPDVADESQAAIIDLTAGGEATDANIKLGNPSKSYVATGRIIDADTGEPLANLRYGHGPLMPQQNTIGAFAWSNNVSNANGEFRIEPLNAGRFAAFVVVAEQADFYSEPAVFEVVDSDVSGLEIKVRRGSSISGVAVIDGMDDADAQLKLSKLELRAYVRGGNLSAPRLAPIPINPDGSFRVTGLTPGKVQITLGGYPQPKGFTLARVERDGMAQPEGVDVQAGETVSGVKVVLGYGVGVVRGEIKLQGGELTPNMRLSVLAHLISDRAQKTLFSLVDSRGRFMLENLLPGDYEITVRLIFVTPSAPGAAPPPMRSQPKIVATQTVNVTNETETRVTLVADLGANDK